MSSTGNASLTTWSSQSLSNSYRQIPADVAVVIPTTLRESLAHAVRSVFAQDLNGRIQILIGIDVRNGPVEQLDALLAECPDHIQLDVIDLGYSTSARHGGLHSCFFGGSLRTILTYMANARHVAYLDDDNWFAPNHLSSLLEAIGDNDWAFSHRWLVNPRNMTPICEDIWESVGADRGVFASKFGGFVDASSLMVEKLAVQPVLSLWSLSIFDRGNGEDRQVFNALKEHYKGVCTNQATSYYLLNEQDPQHPTRLEQLTGRGYHWDSVPQEENPQRPALAPIPETGSARARLAASLIRTASAKERRGQLEEAIVIYEDLLTLAPTDRNVLMGFGLLNLRMGNVADACTIFQFLIEADPEDKEAQQAMAQLRANEGVR